jgi:hypothetical protein
MVHAIAIRNVLRSLTSYCTIGLERSGEEKVDRLDQKSTNDRLVTEFLFEKGFAASYQSACLRACNQSRLASP